MLADIRKLCTPAYVYLVISVVGMVLMMFQNSGQSHKFCAGDWECEGVSPAAVFVGQGIYIAFWTFVLSSICKAGHKNISWFLVLLPLIIMFVAIAAMMLHLNGKSKQAHQVAFIPGNNVG